MPSDVDRRAEVVAALSQVPGWLHPDEAWRLHEAVRAFPSPGPLTVVEIGSWKGKSTIALAMGLQARGVGGAVVAIDPHTGSAEHRGIDTYADFLANVERAGVGEVVRPLRLTSHDARPEIADGSVHVLFVDGSHEYLDVLQDIDDWEPALADTAVVAFNDPVWDGVRRALGERVLVSPSRFRRPSLVVNTLFCEYSRASPWEPRDRREMRRARAELTARWVADRVRIRRRLAALWGRRA